MSEIIYPVSRLLANPRVFFAIANFFEGPDAHTIKESFYELIEFNFAEKEKAEDCVFDADEVLFRIDEETDAFEIVLDSGVMVVLQMIEGEMRSQITNDGEMAAASAIYERLVSAITESHPEFRGNIALCSPPTPGNQYLRSSDGERFEGSFHLLTDPDEVYQFSVEIIDPSRDQLKATIKPT